MTRLKLRNRQSVLASGDEGRAPSSWRMRATTLLYYAVLVSVVAYLVYFVADRVRNFAETGLVATTITQVAPSREGRVTNLPYAPGDTVEAGDLLVVVEPGVECSAPDTTRLVSLTLDARLARARRQIVAAQVAARRSRLDALAGRAGLEVDAELRRERERVARELEELETELALVGTEIDVLEDAIAESAALTVSNDTRCLPDLVYAPFDATVREIHRGVFSVVDAGDPVLSLKAHEPDVRIIARANPDLLPGLFRGKQVRVRFPDGTDDVGVIDTVYAAAAVLPALTIEEYPLLDGDVVIEISPADRSSIATWRESDRLLVEIRGRRARR